MFQLISYLDVDNTDTWVNNFYLTIDIDWAHDDVLSDSIDLVESRNIKATWFVTHDTPLLKRLRCNRKFELGIHPYFNGLLEGNIKNTSNASEIIDRLLDIVPEAKSVRSHSLVQSEKLHDLFAQKGLLRVCNTFIPGSLTTKIYPWNLWNGIIVIPHCWQDNVSLRMSTDNQIMQFPECSLRVFDFHPIHVFLNTEQLERYERTRPLHYDPAKLIRHRFEGLGTRTRLLSLLTHKG